MSLIVATVGGGVERLRRWRDGVWAHLAEPHRLICLTQEPGDVEGVVCIDITEVGLPGPWATMMLFEPQWRGRSKIIFLDLDIGINGDLAPLARVPGEFAICEGEGRRYDARVMVIGGGMAGFVWTAFDTRRDEMMARHPTPAAALAAIYPGAALLKGVPVSRQTG
jgi:hypothetical protein